MPATGHSPKQAGAAALPHGGNVLLVVVMELLLVVGTDVLLVVGLGRMVADVLVVWSGENVEVVVGCSD